MSARSFVLNKRRQGNITINVENGNALVVRLHNTDIVVDDGTMITLNTGGWFTVTTKTAINRYFTLIRQPYRVYQVKGKWFINNIEFKDGMKLYKLPIAA